MKRILFLTPYLPSSKAGGENFTRLLLDDLSNSYYIDLIYFKYESDEFYNTKTPNIRVLHIVNNSTLLKVWNCLKFPIYHPIFTIRFSWRLLFYIKDLLSKEKYDLIYLDHSQMFLYGRFLKKVPKIYMSHDVMAQRFQRHSNKIIWKWVCVTEKKLLSVPNSIIFSFSNKDKAIIKSQYGINSEVTHFFLDREVIKAMPRQIEKRLVFFGKWKRADNFDGLKWFVENVLPILSKDLLVSIVGIGLSQNFQNELSKYENVSYLGFVNNPYNMISNSLAVISPLFSGAGVKVKVVETLACGTPVIGTSIAFEGISSEYEKFMIQANTADDYLQAILNLNVGIDERIAFKQTFLQSYNEKSITSYIARHFPD